MTDPSELRAGDADRDRTITVLREAFAEGRLTEAEFEQRMSSASAARTFADLQALTADLPDAGAAGAPAAPPAPVPAPASQAPPPAPDYYRDRDVRRSDRDPVKAMWASWAGVSLLMVVIWFATGITSDHGFSLSGFWPIWVIAPWGAVNVIATINRRT